jgi:hypothetical protein
MFRSSLQSSGWRGEAGRGAQQDHGRAAELAGTFRDVEKLHGSDS